MIECKKAFIDTAPFIYYIEENKENPRYYSVVQRFSRIVTIKILR